MYTIAQATEEIIALRGGLSHPDGRPSPSQIALLIFGDLLQRPGAPARGVYPLEGAIYVYSRPRWEGPQLTVEARPTAAGGLTVYGLGTSEEDDPLIITWGLRRGWDWPDLRRLVAKMAEAASDWQAGARTMKAA